MSEAKKKRVILLLQDAAARSVRKEDPWAEHNIDRIPAERIVRHLYDPEKAGWTSDETIVKIEKEPFTHGAMRFCFRMKKRAQPPADASNHRFHKVGWKVASNYIAKAYIKNGEIDTSEEAKQSVMNDIRLQYEAQHWARLFNKQTPPKKIHFIRAYAIEFPNRPGKPWLAVERFIAGTDSYGAGFTKHNTNSGFVDTELRRVTPQVFSAFSFYASQGNRLVADIQGVGDMYTDPQVLSSDYRFGDGDLGTRGMALFFHSFRACGSSDSLGIPLFPLSKNELKLQTKYEEDEVTLSDEELSQNETVPLDKFQQLDLNRQRRSMALKSPKDLLPPNKMDTLRRSNLTRRDNVSASVRKSITKFLVFVPPKPIRRTQSDVDEVQTCLERAKSDKVFTHHDFHRLASGELRERHFKDGSSASNHRSSIARSVSAPMVLTDETRMNLGRVHYQLAVLHGSGRFPEVVPIGKGRMEDLPSHDSFSVLFHLSHAAALHNAPACLALARAQSGFESSVSDLLESTVPTDFEAAKTLLRRAMQSPYPPLKPKAAAGCLLFQILHDEKFVVGENGGELTSDVEMMQVLDDTLTLLDELEAEEAEAKVHRATLKRGGGIHPGDRVEADYALEGTYYAAVVEAVTGTKGEEQVTVRYDDDGSSETLPKVHVRPSVPATATQTSLGGPLSDEQAFGSDHGDDSFMLTRYELKFDLAQLRESAGDLASASALYEEAADGAMAAGKMKTATEWSLKAAGLR